ncbi:hypothetical protein NC797_01900 [Aquibacillus sp. 3ASR75-11]|uniref:Uncharacterized protein n=1 Tax=Terrihalobacillus insolitus TaxID=2950438 RepID=A0A9X3WTX3_9BACI|nr:hypothetical protein [Terrihalobacillus insolitus]MDC3412048.1 hypothetical protein [Terrihalobacillus insolitus]MDC3423259.1 hypothetical protein [Terrihalobacillus insolitus]
MAIYLSALVSSVGMWVLKNDLDFHSLFGHTTFASKEAVYDVVPVWRKGGFIRG